VNYLTSTKIQNTHNDLKINNNAYNFKINGNFKIYSCGNLKRIIITI